jgi:NAD(P)H-hydrate epimerase
LLLPEDSIRTTDSQDMIQAIFLSSLEQAMLSSHAPLSVSVIRKHEEKGLSLGLPLMQRAGRSAADFIAQRFQKTHSVLLLIGPGNNGGDALVMGRLLSNEGFQVVGVMPQQATHPPEDAKRALENWKTAGLTLLKELPTERPDCVVDGFFGIGLTKPLRDPWQSIIDTVNEWQLPTLALDTPSGIDADTGQCLGRPMQATWTLCFIAPTLATTHPLVQHLFGEIHVATLDIPV